MSTTRVQTLTDEILALPDPERAQFAEAVLPHLLTTPAGLAGVDEALGVLSDTELETLVERARERGRDLPETTVAEVIGEVLCAVRAPRRS
jgi:hypothetical protein